VLPGAAVGSPAGVPGSSLVTGALGAAAGWEESDAVDAPVESATSVPGFAGGGAAVVLLLPLPDGVSTTGGASIPWLEPVGVGAVTVGPGSVAVDAGGSTSGTLVAPASGSGALAIVPDELLGTVVGAVVTGADATLIGSVEAGSTSVCPTRIL